MIESTNLKMLRNLEAFQVFSDILAFLQEEESVEEPLKGLCDTFAARLSDYDTALVPERRSRYTAELARLDSQRDYVFRSFTTQLKLYQTSFDAAQVKAAEALLALIDKYGRNIPGDALPSGNRRYQESAAGPGARSQCRSYSDAVCRALGECSSYG